MERANFIPSHYVDYWGVSPFNHTFWRDHLRCNNRRIGDSFFMFPLKTESASFAGPARHSWLASVPCRDSVLSPVLFYAAPETLYRDAVLDAWTETFPQETLLDFDTGGEVLQFLWNPIAIKPRLLILDVHTPEPSGLSILQAVRLNPVLCRLPIAILASRSDREAIEAAYALRANWCFQAPVDREGALHLLTGTSCSLPEPSEKATIMAA